MADGTDNIEYRRLEPFLNGWRIERKLGQGSAGRVYEIVKGGERAALKVICLPDGPDDIKRAISSGISRENLASYYDRLTESFVSEYEFMEQLSGNDHIVSYGKHVIIPHEDGIGSDILMRMELLTPLIDYVLDYDLDEEDVLSLGLDISDALLACEKAGILHRDIKPDNIFVSEDGTYKLGDFGVARIIEETEMNLSHKGTLVYMAPEIYRGEPCGMPSDIYSLGLVMYKYLNNGRLPFMPSYPEEVGISDSERALGKRVRKEAVSPPENGSPELKAVVLKACSPDTEGRYKTAAELHSDLEDAASGRTPAHAQEQLAAIMNGETARTRTNNDAGDTDASADRSTTGTGNRALPKSAKIAAAVMSLLLLAAGLIWYAIPKEITDITGIDSGKEIYIGESLSPGYRIEPDWFEEEAITFASSDEKIITVNELGEISAHGLGEADLLLSSKDYSESVHIKVVPKVSKIGGIDSSLEITEGDILQLEPVLSPEKFKDEEVVYDSSDADVAAVTEDGLIVGVSPGTATLNLASGGCTREVAVTVVSKPEPVYYTNSGSISSGSGKGSNKTKSKSNSKSKTDNDSGGYIDSIDDEYFD